MKDEGIDFVVRYEILDCRYVMLVMNYGYELLDENIRVRKIIKMINIRRQMKNKE
jgi:hypothetical protein